MREDDTEKVWNRADYRLGDAVIFHPWVVHAGLPNVSDQIRISVDFRYHRKGDPAPWQAGHRMVYTHNLLKEVREYLDELGAEQKVGRPGMGVHTTAWPAGRGP